MNNKLSKKTIKAKSNGAVFSSVMGSLAKYAKWLLLLAIVLVCLSGVYKVDAGEVAVILRFGKVVGTTYEDQIKEPGLHIAFPFVIDEVVKIPLEKVQELTVSTHYESSNGISTDLKSTGYLLTGDNNIVLLEIKVKYLVSDPVAYAIYSSDVSTMIDGVVSAKATAHAAGIQIDSILTTGKTDFAKTITADAQETLDQIGCGVSISGIELTAVSAPKEAKSYFNAVNSAAVMKSTLIKEAEEYARTTEPAAQAEASALISSALANKSNQIIVTNSELSEIYGYYQQFVDYRASVVDGVLQQRANVILQQGTLIIVPTDGTPPLIVLP